MIRSRIIATGSYLPKKVVTNADLSQTVDTSDEWITSRTGITKRHTVEDELTSDLATHALNDTLKSASLDASSLDAIIVATSTPDLVMPSTATIVQKKLGMKNGFAFDVNAVCSGFIYALATANAMIKANMVKRIAVIGAEVFSNIVNWNDRSTCILFGDGAGAVILECTNQEGIIDIDLCSDGNLGDILKTGLNCKIEMNGKEVFRHAVEKMSSCANQILLRNNMDASNIDWFVPHQANIRILNAVANRLNISVSQVAITLNEHANTSAASIPLALDTFIKRGYIKTGDMLLLTALGAGLTWGSAIVRL